MFEVSVIIPVYNAEKFLVKAIESVLIQPEVAEIILVEDDSPDHCLNICEQYKNKYKKVRLFMHEAHQNRGAAESRNLGVIKATNNFVAFLDADDFYLPCRFKRDKEVFESIKGIDGVYNAIAPYAADDCGNIRLENIDGLMTLNESVPPEELFFKMAPIGRSGFFSLDGLTVKKEALLDVGLFDANLRLSQDTHLCIKLAAKKRLVSGVLDAPVAKYALHTQNRSQDSTKVRSYNPYMFNNLYKWAHKEKMNHKIVNILWEKYYKSTKIEQNLNSRNKQLKLLWKSFRGNMGLIRHKFFRDQLPILGRFK